MVKNISVLNINLPQHIAIIMDGNGRWAQAKGMPRFTGHQAGLRAARTIIQACVEKKIPILTLFAFSSENWRRPFQEIKYLMTLFNNTLEKEIQYLHHNNIRLRVIGSRQKLDLSLKNQILAAEELTQKNTGLQLIIALDYGGQWEILQAVKNIATLAYQKKINPEEITQVLFEQFLCLPAIPYPDLFIRTSGEYRLSNFLLWYLAYTEMYFTPILWPDFDVQALEEALHFFNQRKRRFGHTTEQLKNGLS